MRRRHGPQRPTFTDMYKAFGCIDAMLARLAEQAGLTEAA